LPSGDGANIPGSGTYGRAYRPGDGCGRGSHLGFGDLDRTVERIEFFGIPKQRAVAITTNRRDDRGYATFRGDITPVRWHEQRHDSSTIAGFNDLQH
jgi:hypothetical protein